MEKAIIISDLGFGDAGKGTTIDYLTRRENAHTVVRFNGGAQAAHNVVTPEGIHHTFAQFGSGTFAGARTYLSRFVLVNPLSMFAEEKHLQELGITDGFNRMAIDARAPITTPYHVAINRLRELSRDSRHGSCGMGIGETMSDYLAYGEDVLFAGDLLDENQMRKKLQFLREITNEKLKGLTLPDNEFSRKELRLVTDESVIERCVDIYTDFTKAATIMDEGFLRYLLNEPGTILFEAAQGVLLDEEYGFHPYTTWSKPTFENADTLLREGEYVGDAEKLGLFRAYFTRHGPGPFVTEDQTWTEAIPDYHNLTNEWQAGFRVGPFDLVAARYAMDVVGDFDRLVITNLDRFAELPNCRIGEAYMNGNCRIDRLEVKKPGDLVYQESLTHLLENCTPVYRELPKNEEAYLGLLESELGKKIAITSSGSSANEKRSYD